MQPFVNIGAESFVSNTSLEGLLFENHTYYVTLVCVNDAGLNTTNSSQSHSRHYSLICSSCLWKCGFLQHSQLSEGTRNRGHPKLIFKDIVKGNLQEKAVVLSCQ